MYGQPLAILVRMMAVLLLVMGVALAGKGIGALLG